MQSLCSLRSGSKLRIVDGSRYPEQGDGKNGGGKVERERPEGKLGGKVERESRDGKPRRIVGREGRDITQRGKAARENREGNRGK